MSNAQANMICFTVLIMFSFHIGTSQFVVKQYNTVKINQMKVKLGQDINVYNTVTFDANTSIMTDNNMWFGKVVGVFSHEVNNECIQVLVKIQWYTLSKVNCNNKPNEYELSNSFDFISPASIKGHCLIVDKTEIDNMKTRVNIAEGDVLLENSNSSQKKAKCNNIFYVCNLFSKYYSTYM